MTCAIDDVHIPVMIPMVSQNAFSMVIFPWRGIFFLRRAIGQ